MGPGQRRYGHLHGFGPMTRRHDGHTRHATYCSCGRVVWGNGGRSQHREMHERRGDGHSGLTLDEFRRRFPSDESRKGGLYR